MFTYLRSVYEPWSNTPSRGNEEVEPPGGHSPSPCSPTRGWNTASDAIDARRLHASEASEAAEESTYIYMSAQGKMLP